ncbi:hypothetical protein K437DRAFT_290983 [Tilletiaria anomala UBC 951]|uniref:RRM domain-containing protein n=1 Tax=Tilletiaria anomala (strain ATCC 24038 / CBS 436.72 / UBC 951) TaxID=1037660 RepID=A0A066W0E2_TILAU|nr:uncharacterized protein K437DRAFT_290983 [Tilletiaria anomala UBC 951]KDN44255.1 hypothetical protein K437DRAFT_290983 [Tilletiaria anomala UBC 951]
MAATAKSPRYFEQQPSEVEAVASSPASKNAGTFGSNNTTLFISGLPFTATSTDLSTLFSDIGPLRKCFIVTEPQSKRSKGVGYVQYAVKEDAERALSEMDGRKEGVMDGSRAIRVEWARNRATLKERSEKRKRDGAAAPQSEQQLAAEETASVEPQDSKVPAHTQSKQQQRPAKRPRPSAVPSATAADPSAGGEKKADGRDPNANRTLVLRGLSACKPAADQKSLYKRVRKIGQVESVVYPVPSEAGGASGDSNDNGKGKGKKGSGTTASDMDTDTAYVIFRTPNHAASALPNLHNRTFKAAVLKADLKRTWDGLRRLESSLTNPATLQRRQETIAAIERESRAPAIVRGVLSKVGTKGAKVVVSSAGNHAVRNAAHVTVAPPPWKLSAEVDGRLALARAGGGAVATGKIEKKSRLIVRNLPFDVTPDDLRAIFLPFGPLYKVDIPQTAAPAIDRRRKSKAKRQEDAEEEEQEDDEASDDDEVEIAVKDNEDEGNTGDAKAHAESGDEDTAGNDQGSDDEGDDENDDEESEEGQDDNSDASPEAQGEKEEIKDCATASDTPTRGRGFAFVWFVSYSDASTALTSVNGMSIQHGAAERLAYKSAVHSRDRRQIKVVWDRVKRLAQPARVVAVDWALAKDEWQKKQEEGEDSANEAEPEAEAGTKEEAGEEDSDLEPMAVNDGDDGDKVEEGQLTTLPQPEEGTTLFIRNLPFTASEVELRDLFRAFGSLRYARITMDKATGKSKGNGFVCFWSKDSADKVLDQAELVQRESGASSMTGANAVGMKTAVTANPFSMTAASSGATPATNHYSSLLTADVSAPLAASLSLHGRLLSIAPALKREDAQAREASAIAARQKGDKRNTWLLREGVPFPNSPLAGRLGGSSEGAGATKGTAEIDKRLQSFTVRRKQLETNAALFVSKTRLSVRNLPLFVTDKVLKKLALHSVKEFGREAKAGEREDLSREEQVDLTLSAALEHGSESKRNKFIKERPTAVVQSKIVRQTDRLDPILGSVGRSRGYGFLEMRSFKDALKVVRWANANKDVTKLFVEWHLQELEGAVKVLRKDIASGAEKKESGKGAAAPAGLSAKEDNESRLKRLLKRIADIKETGNKGLDKGERGGLIMIEFSIENVTITRKRQERADHQKSAASKRKERDGDADQEEDEAATHRGPSTSKSDGKRRENWNKKTTSSSGSFADVKHLRKKADGRIKEEKGKTSTQKHAAAAGSSSSLGRILGKKRKERKFKGAK